MKKKQQQDLCIQRGNGHQGNGGKLEAKAHERSS